MIIYSYILYKFILLKCIDLFFINLSTSIYIIPCLVGIILFSNNTDRLLEDK